MSYISDLQAVIKKVHGVECRYIRSVPVKEMFEGKTVWDGVDELFDPVGHPTAFRIYAWAHQTDNPDKPLRHVTVLHMGPIVSPETAVRAAIVQEYRNLEPETN